MTLDMIFKFPLGNGVSFTITRPLSFAFLKVQVVIFPASTVIPLMPFELLEDEVSSHSAEVNDHPAGSISVMA